MIGVIGVGFLDNHGATDRKKKIGKKLNQFFPKGAKQLGHVDTDAIVIVGER